MKLKGIKIITIVLSAVISISCSLYNKKNMQNDFSRNSQRGRPRNNNFRNYQNNNDNNENDSYQRNDDNSYANNDYQHQYNNNSQRRSNQNPSNHNSSRNYNNQYRNNEEKSSQNENDDNEEKSNQKENNLEDKDEKEYQDTIKYVTEAVNAVDLYNNINNCILFVGATGSGKSTTIGYLNEIPMIRKIKRAKQKKQNLKQNEPQFPDDSDSSESEPEEDYIYDFDNTKYNGPEIGHTGLAETLYPEPYKNELWDLFLCDCPGFFDNRGMPFLVAATVGNNLLLRKAKNIKGIAIMCEYNSFKSARAKNFIDGVVKVVDEMFHSNSNFNFIFNSLLFIFTKVPKHVKTKKIYGKLEEMRKDFSKDKDNETHKMYVKYLTYMINKPNIVIMRPDDNHGTYKVEKKKQSKTIIEKMIINFNGIPKNNFKFIGSANTRRKLEGMAAKAMYKIFRPLKYILKEAPNNFILLESENKSLKQRLKEKEKLLDTC